MTPSLLKQLEKNWTFGQILNLNFCAGKLVIQYCTTVLRLMTLAQFSCLKFTIIRCYVLPYEYVTTY